MVDPSLSVREATELAEESDRIRLTLEDAGVTDADLFLRHELQQVEVTEPELQECFDSHRESFGDRNFEESRGALEILVRLHKVRERYGNGMEIGWPAPVGNVKSEEGGS